MRCIVKTGPNSNVEGLLRLSWTISGTWIRPIWSIMRKKMMATPIFWWSSTSCRNTCGRWLYDPERLKKWSTLSKRYLNEGENPTRIRSDKGTEFANRDVKQLLKKEGVGYFVTQNIVKASYAERAIKTIKSRIVHYMTRKQTHRWIDILPKITESYNKTYHRSIKRTPESVKQKDSIDLWKLQYYPKTKRHVKPRKPRTSEKYKFRVGDIVRISFLRRQFQREYDERWSRELYVGQWPFHDGGHLTIQIERLCRWSHYWVILPESNQESVRTTYVFDREGNTVS